MELLNNYSTREYKFTLWFFRILLAMAAVMLLLLFVLRINETVTINDGEIVATNPQSDYKAPYEAQIIKVLAKEGQTVKTGDTLLLMKSLDYQEQYAKTKTEIEYLEKKLQSVNSLENTMQKKKGTIDEASDITSKKYQLDINRLVADMRAMDDQYSIQKEKFSSTTEKMTGDSILYTKDMLSKYEYNTTKDAHLTVKENLNQMASQREKQLSEKNLAYNNFTKEQNTLLQTKVQLEENTQALVQAKIDFQNQLLQAREALKKIETELSKEALVATTPGIVNYIFNTKQSSNLIAKSELLISIAPSSISYYAKITIPEKDMPYLRMGLSARLKLDAYQTFQNGVMTGKLTYIAERKENQNFFGLVELNNSASLPLKSGYKVYGEIVVERLPLYRYFVKKIFKKFDKV